MTLTDLNIRDLRPSLPRAAWSIGRYAPKTSATLHYNGPPVKVAGNPALEIKQLVFDATYHMRPDAFGVGAPGDGVQYHFAVLSDGQICQLRDPDAHLWHAANADANRSSTAIHLPVGVGQTPTAVQWDRFKQLANTLTHGDRAKVKGHREWPKYQNQNGRLVQVPNSACPGDLLMAMLKVWRGTVRYAVAAAAGANIRQGPATTFPVALDGTAKLDQGAVIEIDGILDGVAPDGQGDTRWVHLKNGIGFIWLPLLRAL